MDLEVPGRKRGLSTKTPLFDGNCKALNGYAEPPIRLVLVGEVLLL